MGKLVDESLVMEEVVKRDNVLLAVERVIRNKGVAGVDGMGVKELRPYLREHWLTIKEELLSGSYQPQAIKRVEIPKPNGGVRKLGIPTVLDRLVQQALLQYLLLNML